LINEVLKETMDTELEGDDKCFDVVATLKPSALYLYLSAFLLVVVGLLLLRVYHCAVSERLQTFQHKQLADEFSCLSQDGRHSGGGMEGAGARRRGSESDASSSFNASLSGRSTLATGQTYATLSRITGSSSSHFPLLSDNDDDEQEHEQEEQREQVEEREEQEQEQEQERNRLETMDLSHDDDLVSPPPSCGQYRPPSCAGSAYDQDIDHAASVLTSKSKSHSSTRPATLAQVLSSHGSEEDGQGGGGAAVEAAWRSWFPSPPRR
jgi:hypothetical protein